MPAKALGSTPAHSWGSAHMLAHCGGPRRRSSTHGGLCLKPVRCCLQAAAEVDEASAPAEEPAKQEVESKAAVPAQTQQVEAGKKAGSGKPEISIVAHAERPRKSQVSVGADKAESPAIAAPIPAATPVSTTPKALSPVSSWPCFSFCLAQSVCACKLSSASSSVLCCGMTALHSCSIGMRQSLGPYMVHHCCARKFCCPCNLC